MADAILNMSYYFGNHKVTLQNTATFDLYRTSQSHTITYDLCIISITSPPNPNLGSVYYGMQFSIAATKDGSFSEITLNTNYDVSLSKTNDCIYMTWGSGSYSSSTRYTIAIYEFSYD